MDVNLMDILQGKAIVKKKSKYEVGDKRENNNGKGEKKRIII